MSMSKLAVLCLPLLLAVPAKAQISAGISITNGSANSFHLAIGQNYNVPQREVVVIHERQIPDEELPVVFFIASRAHVRPEEVADLRMSGEFWMDIALHYNLSPSIFYVPLNGDPGMEYGRAYGNWRHPRRQWSRIRLEDDDIIKMVNLQFVSNHYGIRPEEVVRLRDEQNDFLGVTDVISGPDYRSSRATADFYLAVSENYNVSQERVAFIHERQIPDEELPVVFFIASRARVRPEDVVDLRLAGYSWTDITLHYRLNPSIYYVRLNGDPGTEYGSAYGHWRNPRREWTNIRFVDDDIIKMVNLQFVSNHYGIRPDEVVRIRGEQPNFVRVTNVVASPEYRSNGATGEKRNNGRTQDRWRGQGRGQNDNNR